MGRVSEKNKSPQRCSSKREREYFHHFLHLGRKLHRYVVAVAPGAISPLRQPETHFETHCSQCSRQSLMMLLPVLRCMSERLAVKLLNVFLK